MHKKFIREEIITNITEGLRKLSVDDLRDMQKRIHGIIRSGGVEQIQRLGTGINVKGRILVVPTSESLLKEGVKLRHSAFNDSGTLVASEKEQIVYLLKAIADSLHIAYSSVMIASPDCFTECMEQHAVFDSMGIQYLVSFEPKESSLPSPTLKDLLAHPNRYRIKGINLRTGQLYPFLLSHISRYAGFCLIGNR